jgi:CRISPR-associated protein Csm1
VHLFSQNHCPKTAGTLLSTIMSTSTSHVAALRVLQQSTIAISDWAADRNSAQARQPAALQLVFDRIQLGAGNAAQPFHYRPATMVQVQGHELTPRIPYATGDRPTDFSSLKTSIRQAVEQLDRSNLAQVMMFLEVYGSHLSCGAPDSDIAIVDQAKSEAAIAAALAQSPNQRLALVGGDLMGVQKFIYTISSEGALKSLRARSFYLELATEEVVQQILEALALPRTNVIYAGASKFYLLVAATDELEATLSRIQTEFNDWLLKTFQKKVFLAIAHEPFAAADLEPQLSSASEEPPLAQIWQNLNRQLSTQAFRKFDQQLDQILQPKQSHSPCKVCHRDDEPEEKLKPLSNFLGEDSVLACETCRMMFDLGDRLPKIKAIVRSHRSYSDDDIPIQSMFYHPIEHFNWKPNPGEIVFQINTWDLNYYSSNQFVPMLLGNYFQTSRETGGFLSANEMAKQATGIERVGYLRMDVDRLSQIFAKGLGQSYTLPRLACLSRQMTYFFKVYLNSLAQCRPVNFTDYQNDAGSPKFEFLRPAQPRNNLLFIYAGGDDLFVSGAWNETVEFAFDVYQAFRAYTGHHPDITLSAGICIAGAKFPLYQAAAEAGAIEDAAKGNGRDSLGLFNAILKWDEWLGHWHPQVSDSGDRTYLATVPQPALFGVFPFTQRLLAEVGKSHTRSFVRNMLNTAQTQEQAIEDKQRNLKLAEENLKPIAVKGRDGNLSQMEAQRLEQIRDLRYYLHLPKVAYTLARLPAKVRDAPEFQPIRTSLKNPRNAPYFRAIATWIELLNRSGNQQQDSSRPTDQEI